MDSYMNRPRRREGRGRVGFVEADLLDVRSHLGEEVHGGVLVKSVLIVDVRGISVGLLLYGID